MEIELSNLEHSAAEVFQYAALLRGPEGCRLREQLIQQHQQHLPQLKTNTATSHHITSHQKIICVVSPHAADKCVFAVCAQGSDRSELCIESKVRSTCSLVLMQVTASSAPALERAFFSALSTSDDTLNAQPCAAARAASAAPLPRLLPSAAAGGADLPSLEVFSMRTMLAKPSIMRLGWQRRNSKATTQ